MGSVSTQTHSQVGSQRECLSALIDGESPDGLPLGQILAAFGETERRAWSEFHAIGDVLRSDELAIEPAVSHAFSARFSAAFAAEPHLIAPAEITVDATPSPARQALRRRLVPGLAVAAAAAMFTWIVVPQMQGAGQSGVASVQVASVAPQDLQRVSASAHQDANIIRDASLDQYLEAHQQFAQQPVVSGSMPLIRTAVTTQGQ